MATYLYVTFISIFVRDIVYDIHGHIQAHSEAASARCQLNRPDVATVSTVDKCVKACIVVEPVSDQISLYSAGVFFISLHYSVTF